MEIFKIAEYLKKANPDPAKRYSLQLLEKKAQNLVGLLGVIPPHVTAPYHYHNKRESILVIISGKANELLEGKRVPIQQDDILFIPARQKHSIENNSNEEFRYIEFQVGDPRVPDMVEAEWKEG